MPTVVIMVTMVLEVVVVMVEPNLLPGLVGREDITVLPDQMQRVVTVGRVMQVESCGVVQEVAEDIGEVAEEQGVVPYLVMVLVEEVLVMQRMEVQLILQIINLQMGM